MDLFDFDDYRSLVRAKIESLPRKGYGQLSQLAQALGVNSTLVSQVLNGLKNFTEDQGYQAAEFFHFGDLETYFFVLLIQRERAGHHKLKRLLEKRIQAVRKEATKVRNRVVVERELSFEQQAVFYSHWLYTAVHSMTSIEAMQSVDAISEQLGVSRPQVIKIVDWLLQHGLCKEEKGRLQIGPQSTFVDRESPLAQRHHANWRQKSIEVMAEPSERNFFFTAPITISQDDFQKIRQELVEFIAHLSKRVEKSHPELLATINIDYFIP